MANGGREALGGLRFTHKSTRLNDFRLRFVGKPKAP